MEARQRTWPFVSPDARQKPPSSSAARQRNTFPSRIVLRKRCNEVSETHSDERIYGRIAFASTGSGAVQAWGAASGSAWDAAARLGSQSDLP